jgi:hypothetical protein
MSAARQLAFLEEDFKRAMVPVRHTKDGGLEVQCSDATYDYITGPRTAYLAPLLCCCPQREHPHELSVHAELRREWYAHRENLCWPWSLMLSVRVEPSTERKAA